MTRLLSILVFALVAGCSAGRSEPAAAENALSRLPSDVVHDWNEHTIAAATTHDQYQDPLFASRVLAMVNVAMHDAINASGQRSYLGYAYKELDRAAHPIAAAASAAHRVLSKVYPKQAADLDTKLAAALERLPRVRSKARGVEVGVKAGDAIVALRADDRNDVSTPYAPGSDAGDYQLTTPDLIGRPGWQHVTTWALDSADQFRPSAPPALESAEYAADYDEVKSKGRTDSSERSADETSYAHFWYEFSERGWNRVASVAAKQEKLGLAATARLFALVQMALADAYIAGWDAKFHYDFWRPITAIHAADRDRNPATEPDADWSPLLPTPPVQDYPSTHSALGAAGAEVLARFFGERGDAISFSMTSSTALEPNLEMRTFTSFRQAAQENADSRVVAGLHFRSACNAGLALGASIGEHVFENQLPRYE
ncbi:MAG TPA: vanadium-dependent haloperoxidase [Polyangiales bacterium]|nr:vanadium-dependent haloperoxidase [Polyangiales bacterium]